jgi:hypothetical protein
MVKFGYRIYVLMGLAQIKTELHQLIDHSDEKLLRMFYAIAREYKMDSFPSFSMNLLRL